MFLKGKKITYILIIILLTIGIIGCGASRDESMETKDMAQKERATEDTRKGKNLDISLGSDQKNNKKKIETQRKIIKSAHIELETKEFDKTIDAILNRVGEMGGYVESSNIEGNRMDNEGYNSREARFRLRVPSNKFDKFKNDFNDFGNVITSQMNGQDITGEYFDKEAKLESLTIQQERLLEILKKADKVEDIIKLEKELTDVRYEIENITGTIKKWDNLIDYSTFEVSVYEVYQLTESEERANSLGQRISKGFKNSIKLLIDMAKDTVVAIASILPFMVIIVPIILLLLYFIKRYNNNKKE